MAGTVNASAYVTNGTDYAEFVPKLNPYENMTAGDVVGIVNGKATRNTANATTIMVVSGDTLGIIAGGNPLDISGKLRNDWTSSGSVPVAFVGQVKVKVRGAVNDGDWIIPSGSNDGTATAINIENANSVSALARYMKQKVCVAWETNTNVGIKTINCAVMGK